MKINKLPIKNGELTIFPCDWNGYTVHTAMTRQEKDGTKSTLERVLASLVPLYESRVNPRPEKSGCNCDF